MFTPALSFAEAPRMAVLQRPRPPSFVVVAAPVSGDALEVGVAARHVDDSGYGTRGSAVGSMVDGGVAEQPVGKGGRGVEPMVKSDVVYDDRRVGISLDGGGGGDCNADKVVFRCFSTTAGRRWWRGE